VTGSTIPMPSSIQGPKSPKRRAVRSWLKREARGAALKAAALRSSRPTHDVQVRVVAKRTARGQNVGLGFLASSAVWLARRGPGLPPPRSAAENRAMQSVAWRERGGRFEVM